MKSTQERVNVCVAAIDISAFDMSYYGLYISRKQILESPRNVH